MTCRVAAQLKKCDILFFKNYVLVLCISLLLYEFKRVLCLNIDWIFFCTGLTKLNLEHTLLLIHTTVRKRIEDGSIYGGISYYLFLDNWWRTPDGGGASLPSSSWGQAGGAAAGRKTWQRPACRTLVFQQTRRQKGSRGNCLYFVILFLSRKVSFVSLKNLRMNSPSTSRKNSMFVSNLDSNTKRKNPAKFFLRKPSFFNKLTDRESKEDTKPEPGPSYLGQVYKNVKFRFSRTFSSSISQVSLRH